MRFTWGPRKAASNRKKHGVSFEEATEAVLDPLALREPDAAHDDGREYLVGRSESHRTLFVVFIEVHEDTIRIISARRATNRERQAYEES